jgi:hypothetical protein
MDLILDLTDRELAPSIRLIILPNIARKAEFLGGEFER